MDRRPDVSCQSVGGAARVSARELGRALVPVLEEMFYLFFPLLCRLTGRGRGLVAVLVVFVVLGPFGRTVLAHGNDTWQEYSYLGGMDALAQPARRGSFVGPGAIQL